MASLKQENSKLQGSLVLLQGSHDKATHENKLLKRLVTHQHEKQNQAHVELEAARKYKEEAQDAITKMEQMILQLRYHLQTQQTPMTDMGGFHRHSDVY
jgi:DNA-directed RNA polymerase specialized sigma subunit